MAKRKSSSFIVGHDLELIKRQKEKGYAVSLSDWNFIKQKVQEIEAPSVLFNTIGSSLAGISASSFVAGITLSSNLSNNILHLCWYIFGLSSLVSVLSFIFDSYINKRRISGSKKVVMDELSRLEAHFINH
jgi:hypothetical protein